MLPSSKNIWKMAEFPCKYILVQWPLLTSRSRTFITNTTEVIGVILHAGITSLTPVENVCILYTIANRVVFYVTKLVEPVPADTVNPAALYGSGTVRGNWQMQ